MYNSNDNKSYKKVVGPDEIVAGYYPPSTKQAHYIDTTITYQGVNGDEIFIRQKNLPLLLRELRLQGSEAWNFATIFQNKGKPMQGLKEFEESLQTSQTTALIDYWLLRLGGTIRELPKSDAKEAQYLTELYDDLVKKISIYEQAMGKLATNPSRHQNADRQELVQKFQQEWKVLIEPAEQKYKQKDIKNILKNVAAACTVVGLLWLFCKNLYRLTQRKELGLFQFGEANSRKLEHLQKLYDDLPKATAAHAAEKENFFTNDIEDARKSCLIFMQTIGELQALHTSTKLDALYTEEDQDTLEIAIEAFMTPLNIFSRKLNRIKSTDEDAELVLVDLQKSFMQNWQKAVEKQGLTEKIGEESPYPEDIQTAFKKIIDISTEFGKELEQINTERVRRPSSPGGSSTSGSSY